MQPLLSFQAHTMENCQLSLTSSQAAGPSLFTISPLSPSSPLTLENTLPCFDDHLSCSLHADIITPSSYQKSRSEQDLTFKTTHTTPLPLPLSTLSATKSCPINGNSSLSQPPFLDPIKTAPCQHSYDADDDDGSVARKLLSSITKSISSPSLQLASSKESSRETPYQKALKLKQMKLQHCAEELGTESSDHKSSLSYSNEQVMYEGKIDIEGNAHGLPPSFKSSNSHQDSSLKSVRSLPNLSSALPLMTNQSRYTRSTSFPPPLSHTLPTSSASSESLSFSLRAYREDGRFILKETMVPSKHYFQARRTSGRLTLHIITRDGEAEDEDGVDRKKSTYMESREDDFVDVVEDEVCAEKSIGMHSIKDPNVAVSHLDISLQKMSCTAHHHNHISNEDREEDDKGKVVSNVITLNLKTSSLSKVTLHKAQLVSYPPQRSHGSLSSNHDISTFSQSKQNFMWESNLMPYAAAMNRSQCLKRKGKSSGGGGAFGRRAGRAPAFVLEEMREKSLIEAVSELGTSLMLEASYGNQEWCLAGKKNLLLSAVESGEYGSIAGGYASDNIDKAMIKGKLMGEDGQVCYDGAFLGYNSSYFKEEQQAGDGGKELHYITTTPVNLDLQCSSPSSWEEWLHTLHCKDLFNRHHLGHGLTKLPCIPTRS